uniref:Uncharacterized protein n=1 Tax=Oryza sativa subsp. japonica TaxID=39947 RepID=Q2R477_ORYSJ|nr:hypothetical protein LOC_Os11g29430 [Oryza sativa Japonica Group]
MASCPSLFSGRTRAGSSRRAPASRRTRRRPWSRGIGRRRAAVTLFTAGLPSRRRRSRGTPSVAAAGTVILTPPHLRRLTPLDRPRLLTTPSMPSTAAHWLSSRARARRAGAHAAAAAACLGQRTRRRAASGRPYTDEILQYMGRSCKQEHELTSPQASGGGSSRPASRYLRPIDIVLDGHGLMKLPPLESPSAATTLSSTPSTAAMRPRRPPPPTTCCSTTTTTRTGP